MPDIPVLSGVVAGEAAEFGISYPVNLEPVPVENKIARGQLKLAPGTVAFTSGPGVDRGAVLWNGQHYRVMGDQLCQIDATGAVTELGTIAGDDECVMDYSFDRLAIAGGGNLYYWDNSTLTQVTDEDLGTVEDMIWVDGFFMTSDGTFIIVTELKDPTQVEPLKYGSAEEDPDQVVGIIKLRNEVYAVGRHTTEVFTNVGGIGFPFRKIDGATIPYGAISRTAKTEFAETFAFCGSARGEALGIYLAGNGSATKISTRAIDDFIAALPDPENIILEARVDRDEHRLLVHTSDGTLIYLLQASRGLETAVWYTARSNGQTYRIRHPLRIGGKWYAGDTESGAVVTLDDTVDTHFGETAPWKFEAGLVYNDATGGILHSAELIGANGRADDEIFFSITRDGQFWSNEQVIRIKAGERGKRLQWRPSCYFDNYIGLRFRGRGRAGIAKLKAVIEPLSV